MATASSEADGETDLAIDYLRRRSGQGKPFALVVSWGPPHDPWTAENTPRDLAALFDPADFPNPPNYATADVLMATPGRASRRLSAGSFARGARTTRSSVRHRQEPRQALAAMDELGLSDNALLVFTSDHGEMFGAHGRRAKNTFYEEACRVPLLFRRPGCDPSPEGSASASGRSI